MRFLDGVGRLILAFRFRKTKPPDPTAWMRAHDENTHFFVESLLSKFGRPGRFHPNPEPRGPKKAAAEASFLRRGLSLQ